MSARRGGGLIFFCLGPKRPPSALYKSMFNKIVIGYGAELSLLLVVVVLLVIFVVGQCCF